MTRTIVNSTDDEYEAKKQQLLRLMDSSEVSLI